MKWKWTLLVPSNFITETNEIHDDMIKLYFNLIDYEIGFFNNDY